MNGMGHQHRCACGLMYNCGNPECRALARYGSCEVCAWLTYKGAAYSTLNLNATKPYTPGEDIHDYIDREEKKFAETHLPRTTLAEYYAPRKESRHAEAEEDRPRRRRRD
jgi:hypothetical protein